MTDVRLQFINWQPDLEDEANDGLTVADNVIHEVEGYKPVYLKTAAAFTTNTAVGTTTSIQIRNVGSADNQVAAWVDQIDASTGALRLGVPGTGEFSGAAASSTLTSLFVTTGSPSTIEMAVQSFEAAELGGYIVMTAVAKGTQNPTASTLTYITGYTAL